MPLPVKLPANQKKNSSLLSSSDRELLANRYQVLKQLGTGNCGTALLVLDIKEREEKEKQKVAKKIFVGNLQPDETVDAAHEASLLRNLNCPGIVKFYDSFVEREFFCIVTEFCEGGDLDDRIEKYRKNGLYFQEQQIVEWIIELLLALKYMHSRKILHRDLKSRNIFLRNERVKIGDFGISRLLMGSSDMASTFVGTPYYMSPEVLKHEGYNSKSDIWSLGCILYDLVALEHPFQGGSLMGVMFAITEGPLPPWPKRYSQELGELFYRTLEKDPNKRPSALDALRFPFVVRQFEEMKTTLMERQLAKEQNDLIARDTTQIANEFNRRDKFIDLQRESEYKKEKNLPPRERMRKKKEREADEAGRRLLVATMQQKKENEAKRQEIKGKNNPYESTLQIGGRSYKKETDTEKKRISTYPGPSRGRGNSSVDLTDDDDDDDDNYIRHNNDDNNDYDDEPFTAAIRRHSSQSDSNSSDKSTPRHRVRGTAPQSQGGARPEAKPTIVRGFSADDERPISPMKRQNQLLAYGDSGDKKNTSGTSKAQTRKSKSGELSRTMGELRRTDEPLPGGRDRRSTLAIAAAVSDDRPITPMRDRMVYNVAHSSLDFKDGIPDRPDMADTYYEQFDDFNEDADDDDDDDDDNEIIDMVSNLQTVLNNDSTLTENTLVKDDMQAGAFGPGARDIKVRNLRIEAEKKLGKQKFEKVYNYLKKVRFEERPRGKQIDEKKVMADLQKLKASSEDGFLVEQLLFLEVQQRESLQK